MPPYMNPMMMQQMHFQQMQQMQMQQGGGEADDGAQGDDASEESAGPSQGPSSAPSAPAAAPPAAAASKAAVPNPCQNNPISKLYEHCKRAKLAEPVFETIAENVLEKKKTQQGFMLKKTEFTIQCTIQGKKFSGSAMTKKQAKHAAAAAAWAEVGEGVKQTSIDSLLHAQRNETAAAAANSSK